MMRRLLHLSALGALGIAAPAADFSYYMLSLSYAPNFCAQPGMKKDPRECGPGRKAFVVHGLWPQNDNGRGPQNCGAAHPVPADLVRSMLSYMPSESLIQHEWATHGTCSGLTPAEYFAAIRRLADSVRIPPAIEEARKPIILSPQDLENGFAQTNPGIPMSALRVSCGGDQGLQEIRVCFDKKFIVRECTGSSECTMPRIGLLPAKPPR